MNISHAYTLHSYTMHRIATTITGDIDHTYCAVHKTERWQGGKEQEAQLLFVMETSMRNAHKMRGYFDSRVHKMLQYLHLQLMLI